MISTTKH